MTQLVRSHPEITLLKVPNNWMNTRVKYGAQINGQKLYDNTPDDFEFEYVEISTVNSDGTLGDPTLLRFADAPSRARRIVQSGDTIISTVRTYLKAVAFFEESHDPLICSTGFAVLSPLKQVEPRFLYYWVRSSPFVDAVVAHSKGVSYPAVNPSAIGDLPLALPPASRQKAISKFLDRETERIDLLVNKKSQLIELLEEKRTALISHAVTKGLDPTVPMKSSGIPWLGDIPAHWDVLPIRRVARYMNSNVDKKSVEGEIRILLCNYTDVYYGSYLESTEGFMEATATPDEIRKFHLRAGNVLITKDSETADDIGVPAFVSRDLDAVCGYHLTVMDPSYRRMRGDYLYWALESSSLRASFEVVAKGVTRFGLTLEGMGATKVPVPPLDEQREIALRLRNHGLQSTRVVEKINNQIEKLAEYRQALITSAVTGQIDVATYVPEPVKGIV